MANQRRGTINAPIEILDLDYESISSSDPIEVIDLTDNGSPPLVGARLIQLISPAVQTSPERGLSLSSSPVENNRTALASRRVPPVPQDMSSEAMPRPSHPLDNISSVQGRRSIVRVSPSRSPSTSSTPDQDVFSQSSHPITENEPSFHQFDRSEDEQNLIPPLEQAQLGENNLQAFKSIQKPDP